MFDSREVREAHKGQVTRGSSKRVSAIARLRDVFLGVEFYTHSHLHTHTLSRTHNSLFLRVCLVCVCDLYTRIFFLISLVCSSLFAVSVEQ